MKPRILLVSPPIYDFSAYDFWLKPPDRERCRSWIDIDEPLRHNKTAFAIARRRGDQSAQNPGGRIEFSASGIAAPRQVRRSGTAKNRGWLASKSVKRPDYLGTFL